MKICMKRQFLKLKHYKFSMLFSLLLLRVWIEKAL